VDDNCDGVLDNCSHSVSDAMLQVTGAGDVVLDMGFADVDADGVIDLVVGSPDARKTHGGAYVVFGPATGARTPADADRTIVAYDYGGYFGARVVGGDANGDAFDDLLITSPRSADRLFLFYGPLSADDAPDADTVFVGPDTWYIGDDVALVSDCDGDGVGDFLVGEEYSDDGWSSAVYIVPGDAKDRLDVATEATQTWTLSADNKLGAAVAGIGDTTGDGIDEMAFGSQTGDVYVVEGGAAAGSYDLATNAMATLSGEVAGEAIGGGDLAAADYDGDGLPDVFVSSPYAQIGSAAGERGRAYAFLSPLGGDVPGTSAETIWVSKADDYDERLGTSIAAADIDGDDRTDVLIGVEISEVADASGAYLQLGPLSGTVEVTMMSAFGDTGGKSVAAVAFVPDWTGDGLPEVALQNDASEVTIGDVGMVWVISSENLH